MVVAELQEGEMGSSQLNIMVVVGRPWQPIASFRWKSHMCRVTKSALTG
jgi:hypothetical protein